MNSLDPRVVRLPDYPVKSFEPKAPMDQLGTYEVFVQPKEGKQFQHEGIVHAPDIELAFVLAKESLTRRFQCVSIFIVDTRNVLVSELTEGDVSAYDTSTFSSHVNSQSGDREVFEIFHLTKRGKQHIHAGNVEAESVAGAFAEAKKKFGILKVYNVWIIATKNIRFTQPDEKDLWSTLPDKKFRDAAEYKGGDKLKEFLKKSQ